MVKKIAIFTGQLRIAPAHTNQSVEKKVSMLKKYGIEILFVTWHKHMSPSEHNQILDMGVNTLLLHDTDVVDDNGLVIKHSKNTIGGRQRQVYMAEQAIKVLKDDCKVLKLRWDLDFNEALLDNFVKDDFLEKIPNGLLDNKVWTSFYSIQELFSTSDQCYFGYKKDLEKLVKFNYKFNDISAYNFISHDGMHLMPLFVEKNKHVQNLIQNSTPKPSSLMFTSAHESCQDYIKAWAYNYYIFNKYFKTGPLGTSFFKKGDRSRWPAAIVDYDEFYKNYITIISNEGRLNGGLPRYRVYDDIFITRLVAGEYKDDFAENIFNAINDNKQEWESLGI